MNTNKKALLVTSYCIGLGEKSCRVVEPNETEQCLAFENYQTGESKFPVNIGS